MMRLEGCISIFSYGGWLLSAVLSMPKTFNLRNVSVVKSSGGQSLN